MDQFLIFLGFTLWTIATLCVGEYITHKYFMHRWVKLFPKNFYTRTFYEHAILHHAQGKNHLNIDLKPYPGLVILSPVWITLLFIQPLAALAITIPVFFHAWFWTSIHRSFHGLTMPNKLVQYMGYNLLLKHHVEHHRRPGKNFGTAFGPTADFIFGTLS